VILSTNVELTVTGTCIFSFSKEALGSHCAIFSNLAPQIVFAVTPNETLRLNMINNSAQVFKGHPFSHVSGSGNAMALSSDDQVLFVGYSGAQRVIAHNVATTQSIWSSQMTNRVTSVSYHAGTVLVGVKKSDFLVLNATDGTVLRKICKSGRDVFGHAVIEGMWHSSAIESLCDIFGVNLDASILFFRICSSK
jgi:hypothetical protein